MYEAILRPVAAAAMKLPSRPPVLPRLEADHCSESVRVMRRAKQSHADSRTTAHVSVEFGLCSALSDNKVQPTVTVEVPRRSAALFAVNLDPAFLARHSLERPGTVIFE